MVPVLLLPSGDLGHRVDKRQPRLWYAFKGADGEGQRCALQLREWHLFECQEGSGYRTTGDTATELVRCVGLRYANSALSCLCKCLGGEIGCEVGRNGVKSTRRDDDGMRLDCEEVELGYDILYEDRLAGQIYIVNAMPGACSTCSHVVSESKGNMRQVERTRQQAYSI